MENDRIRVLPDGVANQIAAGEVVGRPASVVKELMENAVDAGSTSVTVNYRDGGRALIQVVDDGCGMSQTDARLAFERHATSKIRSADDLFELRSFGFRGEALPSIASVAEVELRTRPADSELGVQIVIHGGRFIAQESVQTPSGTQFLVRNLFYNTPARRRFLKEANVEARHIRTEFLRVALCNPEVAFALYDSDTLLATLPAANLRQRIVAAVGGREIASNLLDVSVDTSMVRIEGFVGRPSAAKKTNRDQYLFVNGRYFNSPYFRKAILQAYDKLVAPDTQPSYFLYITVDPSRIDVNVHPQKTEIKFEDEQALWQIFNAAVRESLGKLGVVPMMDFEIDSSFDIPVMQKGIAYKEPGLGVNPDFNPFADETRPQGRTYPQGQAAYPRKSSVRDWEQLYEVESGANGMPEPDENSFSLSDGIDPSILEYIDGTPQETGQAQFDLGSEVPFRGLLSLGDRYLLTATREGLAVVDVPRAYERILYERYLGMLGNESSATQQLLFPETVELSAAETAQARESAAELSAAGFDVAVGSGMLTVTGIPADLSAGRAQATLRDLLAGLHDGSTLAPAQRLERVAGVMARHGAASRTVTPDGEAAAELLRELFASPHFNYTPGGIPVLTYITETEIAKRLK